MKLLCLCPLYNHKQSLTETALACFEYQTHKEATLLLIDDRPPSHQLPGVTASVPNVALAKFPTRFPSIGAKYNAGIAWAKEQGIEFDALSIWDGDDLYFPRHLELSALAMETSPWCYPKHIFYTSFGNLVLHPTGQRSHWGCCSFPLPLLDALGGFEDERRMGFDQLMVAALHKAGGPPGSPTLPTYLYRWESTQGDHASGHSEGFQCTKWWDRVPCIKAGGVLESNFDEDSLAMLIQANQHSPESLRATGQA